MFIRAHGGGAVHYGFRWVKVRMKGAFLFFFVIKDGAVACALNLLFLFN